MSKISMHMGPMCIEIYYGVIIMANKKGPIYMLITAFFFSLISTISKMIQGIPLTEKLFISSFLGFIIIFIYNLVNKVKILGNNKKLLFLRGFLGVVGLFLFHFSVSKMSLSIATVLYKTTPIFVLVISAVFFNEKVSKKLVVALMLVFTGTVLLTRPSLNIKLLPVITALTAAIITAVAYIVVSELKKTEEPTTLVLYYLLCSAVFMLPGIGTGTWIVPTTSDIFLMLLMGILTVLSQLFLNLSYRNAATVNDVTIYLNVEIFFSFLIDLIIFKGSFDIISIIGGALIIIAIYIVLFRENDDEEKECIETPSS